MKKKISRRKFIKLSASSVATVFTLTACGELFAMGNRVRTVTPKASDEPGFIITLDELKESGVMTFMHNDKKAILVYIEGELRAYENICTHKGGPTEMEDDLLVCQWHSAAFDPLTGKALNKPAPENSRLQEIKLKVIDKKIFVVINA